MLTGKRCTNSILDKDYLFQSAATVFCKQNSWTNQTCFSFQMQLWVLWHVLVPDQRLRVSACGKKYDEFSNWKLSLWEHLQKLIGTTACTTAYCMLGLNVLQSLIINLEEIFFFETFRGICYVCCKNPLRQMGQTHPKTEPVRPNASRQTSLDLIPKISHFSVVKTLVIDHWWPMRTRASYKWFHQFPFGTRLRLNACTTTGSPFAIESKKTEIVHEIVPIIWLLNCLHPSHPSPNAFAFVVFLCISPVRINHYLDRRSKRPKMFGVHSSWHVFETAWVGIW